MGSTSATKGRKKRSSKALDENETDVPALAEENGDTAVLKSKRARTTKDNGQAQETQGVDDQFFEYSGLMAILPEVEAALVARGESVARPDYTNAGPPAAADIERTIAEAEDDGDAESDEEQVEVKKERTRRGKGKENFEATSDEDE
ncbi:MAG: hypothetical protein Q9184_003384 [Pyrenodesmia sp. 2 TL-2023]